MDRPERKTGPGAVLDPPAAGTAALRCPGEAADGSVGTGDAGPSVGADQLETPLALPVTTRGS